MGVNKLLNYGKSENSYDSVYRIHYTSSQSCYEANFMTSAQRLLNHENRYRSDRGRSTDSNYECFQNIEKHI